MSDAPDPTQSDEELAAAWGAETEDGDAAPAQPARPQSKMGPPLTDGA